MLPDEIDFGFRKDATLFEKPISSRSKSPVFAQSSSLAEFQDVLYDRTPECQATPDASPLQDRKSPIRQVYSSIGSPVGPWGHGEEPRGEDQAAGEDGEAVGPKHGHPVVHQLHGATPGGGP